MDNVLEISHLKKKYGKHIISEDLSFQIGKQEIVGFLGPNGSGKSTTLKCVTGLTHLDGGEIKVGGHSIVKERKKALSLMGISIENPALYPSLSGRDHLKMIAQLRGVSDERVKEMEEFSGLGVDIKKEAGRYSMGMKMRLMLAIALLHKPKLLILDEPTNGLDPQAVFQLREEMKEIRESGASILFSSHQLGEVEKVADRVIFIRKGSKIYDGALSEEMKQGNVYRLLLSDKGRAAALMERTKGVLLVKEKEDTPWLSFSTDGEEVLGGLVEQLVEEGIAIMDMGLKANDLESFYRTYYKE